GLPAREKILILPKEALLPVEKFRLGLEGNDIVIKSHDKDLSKGQVEMMETMTALYNLTGKIADIKKTATLGLYYKDRPLFDLLLEGRDVKDFLVRKLS